MLDRLKVSVGLMPISSLVRLEKWVLSIRRKHGAEVSDYTANVFANMLADVNYLLVYGDITEGQRKRLVKIRREMVEITEER